jgi:hypothetical protein
VEGVPNIFISLWYFWQTVDDSLADLEKLPAVAQSRHETFVLQMRQEKSDGLCPDAHRPVSDANPHLVEKSQGETRTGQAAVASGGMIGIVRRHAFS